MKLHICHLVSIYAYTIYIFSPYMTGWMGEASDMGQQMGQQVLLIIPEMCSKMRQCLRQTHKRPQAFLISWFLVIKLILIKYSIHNMYIHIICLICRYDRYSNTCSFDFRMRRWEHNRSNATATNRVRRIRQRSNVFRWITGRSRKTRW